MQGIDDSKRIADFATYEDYLDSYIGPKEILYLEVVYFSLSLPFPLCFSLIISNSTTPL